MSPEERFARELENLRRESDAAAQFLYSWLAFHNYASGSRVARKALNRNALFWNTHLGALQTSLFMSLGRIFDKDPRSHSINRLLAEASENPKIFSRESLAARKRKQSPGAKWVRDYVKGAYVPTKNDFSRLARYVANKRKIYEKAYGPIRHKIFAHSSAVTTEKKDSLFSETQLGELQRLVLSLKAFHEAMWQLYFNGVKPTIKRSKYATSSMSRDVSQLPFNAPIEQRVFAEGLSAFALYVAGAQQGASADAKSRAAER